MKPRHQVSRTAIDLIKRFEGYRRHAAQLPDGGWVIGYGHTLTARQGARVSEADAEALLLYDLIAVALAVNAETYAPLNQNQFDALCCFAFSIGLESFRRSAVLKRINEGAFAKAAFGLELWRMAKFEGETIVVDALIRRRAAEKLLFLTPPGGAWPPAPSPVLRPLIDLEGPDATPRQSPAAIVTETDGEQVRMRREPAEPALPPPEPHPVTAAAEQVAARLQAIFPDDEDPAPPAPEMEAGPDLGQEPDVITIRPEPERDPHVRQVIEEPPERAPPPLAEDAAAPAQAAWPEPETAPLPDLDPPQEIDDPLEVAAPPIAEDEADPPCEAAQPAVRRILIDDTAPFEFVPSPVQALPQPSADGVLSVVFLAILGLAFFAGGVFWALEARPAGTGQMLTPRLVGWLAGLAGAGFLAAAVFTALQRLARSAERRGDGARL